MQPVPADDRVSGDVASLATDPLDILLDAVEELSLAHHLEPVGRIVCSAARHATAADGATLVLRDARECFYAEEDAIAPLWKGRRFPLDACPSGWSIRKKAPVTIEDVYADDRVPHDEYRPTFVKSLLVIPIRRIEPVGAIGVYWADRHLASGREIGLTSALADSTAVALEQVRAAERVRRAIQLAHSDPRTGLPSRRAWLGVLGDSMRAASGPISVVMARLDRSQAGGDLMRDVGTAWRDALRTGDLLGRYGDEQFAVLITGGDISAAMQVAERLREEAGSLCRASFGIAQWDGRESVTGLVSRATQALDRAKSGGGNRVAI